MFHFLLGLAGVELRDTARRAATTTLLFALGGLMLMFASIGVLAAIFFALAARYDPVVAALLVAAGTFVAAAVFLLIAYARLKRPARRPGALAAFARPPAPPIVPPAPGVAPGMPPPDRPPLVGGKTLLGVAAGAALIGLILGRRI